MISKKHKKLCTASSFIKHSLILASVVTRYASIFAFASSVGIPIGIATPALELKICAITAGTKKQLKELKCQ